MNPLKGIKRVKLNIEKGEHHTDEVVRKITSARAEIVTKEALEKLRHIKIKV
ncbi:hypothetical protein CFPU101_16600 [Chroococcus sp. FPU101]|nr:hypothetical protein CFPU101_16600 [Chroococcus sp. FPU101]